MGNERARAVEYPLIERVRSLVHAKEVIFVNADLLNSVSKFISLYDSLKAKEAAGDIELTDDVAVAMLELESF